jgi:glucose/arabinose dehydrogenase
MRPLLSSLFLLCLVSTLFAAERVPAEFHDSLVARGLYRPVSCEFAPDGRLFILLKQGIIRIVRNGQLLPQPALKIPVNTHRERGLGHIAFDPLFAENGYIYLYYTAATQVANRLSRFTVFGDLIDPGSEKVLLDKIISTGIHNGGCLKFGKAGKLFVSTGDGGRNPNLSQNLFSLNGKILRINKDGSIPADNPFFGQLNRRGEIWAYGLRNPWRFAFDSKSGMMVISDVGEDLVEEINIGKAGGNYGWPRAEGKSTNRQFINPVFSYAHGGFSAAVTGGVIYDGKTFPKQYLGAYFFGDYVRGFIRYLKFNADQTVQGDYDFAFEAGPVVHITKGPDDALYYVVFNGEVRRIQFQKGRNSDPTPEVSSSTHYGVLPLTVQFSAEGSFDPDAEPLRFRWEFGDGSGASGKIVEHTYTRSSNFETRCVVTDARGARSISEPLRIFAGDRAPVPLIAEPKPGTSARTGQRVMFSGSATDPEDGPIDPSRLVWTVILLHNKHTHPFLGPLAGVSGGSFVLPRRHGGQDVAYRIRLRATDSRGLSIIRQVEVYHTP